MKRFLVLVALAGCMTPPARAPAAGVPSPGSARPSEWSLRRVDYDVGASGAVAAPDGGDVRFAFVRRCGGSGAPTSVTETSGRDEAISPHLDRALALWSKMELNPGHTGCDVLRLEYRRGGGQPVPDPDRLKVVSPVELRARCISCPSSSPPIPVTPGVTMLSGCLNESGEVVYSRLLRSGGDDADLISFWLFGASSFRPYMLYNKPLFVCAPFGYNLMPIGF